ncbi:MAG: phosphatidylserine decarboxylase [Pseudomonadota bacterium]
MARDADAGLNSRFPWARAGFDLEGLAFAAAAWLMGVLLGLIWGPLFWFGFVAAIGCLLGGRRAGRTVPEAPDAIIAPCDGVVASVTEASPPSELRLGDGVRKRIRVASSPASTNGIYAPLTGGLDAVVEELGDPSQPFATNPDAFGLATLYVSASGGGADMGMRVVSGGLGPRIERDVETGDAVRAGRRIARRRLGGWCDIYLPEAASALVEPGMTLVGGETLVAALSDAPVLDIQPVEDVEAVVTAASDDDLADAIEQLAEESEPAPEAAPEKKKAEPSDSEADVQPDEVEEPGGNDPRDPASMFAKLKREAAKDGDKG